MSEPCLAAGMWPNAGTRQGVRRGIGSVQTGEVRHVSVFGWACGPRAKRQTPLRRRSCAMVFIVCRRQSWTASRPRCASNVFADDSQRPPRRVSSYTACCFLTARFSGRVFFLCACGLAARALFSPDFPVGRGGSATRPISVEAGFLLWVQTYQEYACLQNQRRILADERQKWRVQRGGGLSVLDSRLALPRGKHARSGGVQDPVFVLHSRRH